MDEKTETNRNEKERMELNLETLHALRVLGRGAMGTVFLITAAADPSSPPLAIKVVDKHSPTARPDADRRARWELDVLSGLRHPLLPSLLAAGETPDFIFWALPFCSGRDLNALRHSLPDRSLSISAIRFYMSEIIEALAYLHSLHIVFRDLKPENVLLRANGHIVLSDFDLSRRIPPSDPPPGGNPPPRPRHRRNLTRIWPIWPPNWESAASAVRKTSSARVSPARAAAGKAHSFVGTEEYVAPEIVRGEGHDFAVDWWALGILAYEMAFGKTPFKGRTRKETFRNVLAREPELPSGGSARRRKTELENLITELLEKDPARRLGAGGAEEVRAHPFFRGLQWDMLTEVNRPPYVFEDEGEAVAGSRGDGTASEGFDIREYLRDIRVEKMAALSPAAASTFEEF